MSTHVVYKFMHPETKDVIYVGSGTVKRPRASLNNSHIDGIRELKDVIDVVVSKPMSEKEARQKEAELIQKYHPEFKTNLPKVRFDRLVVDMMTSSSLNLTLDDAEFLCLRNAYAYLEDCPVLVNDTYMVWRDDEPSETRLAFKIKDSNCSKPIKFSCNSYRGLRRLTVNTDYDNLYVASVAARERSFMDTVRLPFAVLDMFLAETFLAPQKFSEKEDRVAVGNLCFTDYLPVGKSLTPPNPKV